MCSLKIANSTNGYLQIDILQMDIYKNLKYSTNSTNGYLQISQIFYKFYKWISTNISNILLILQMDIYKLPILQMDI